MYNVSLITGTVYSAGARVLKQGGGMGSFLGGGTWRARAYNGGLGAEPAAGSRGKGQRVRGEAPPP